MTAPGPIAPGGNQTQTYWAQSPSRPGRPTRMAIRPNILGRVSIPAGPIGPGQTKPAPAEAGAGRKLQDVA